MSSAVYPAHTCTICYSKETSTETYIEVNCASTLVTAPGAVAGEQFCAAQTALKQVNMPALSLLWRGNDATLIE